MKKYLAIGGAALVVLGGVTLKTGSTYEAESRRALDQALSDPALELVSHDVESGFFGSQEALVLAMDLGYGDRLLIRSASQARYFPGWARFAGGMEIEIEESNGKVVSINDTLNLPAFPYQGTANWRGATLDFNIPDIDFSEDGVEITARDLQLGMQYRFGGATHLEMSVGAIDIAESWSENGLRLRHLSTLVEQEGEYPWVSSSMTLGIESLDFIDQSGWNSTSLSLAGFEMQQDVSLTPAALNYALKLSQDTFLLNDGFLLNDLVLEMHTENVLGEPAANLLDIFVNEVRGEEKSADAVNAMRYVTELLAASPALVVDQMRFQMEVMGEEINESFFARLGFNGEGLEASLVESVLFDMGPRSQRYDNEEAFFARLQLRAELQELNAGLLRGMMLPIPTDYLVPEGPQVFLLENGEFTLNGQALSL